MLDFAFKIISLGITTCFCILMGKITREDRIVLKALRVEKNWSSCRFLKEFASKAWCRSSLDRLIKKNRSWIITCWRSHWSHSSLATASKDCSKCRACQGADLQSGGCTWHPQESSGNVAPTSMLSVYYDKIFLKFAPHHFLLYAVYICKKSLNFTYAFKCYQQKWPHFSWTTLYTGAA